MQLASYLHVDRLKEWGCCFVEAMQMHVVQTYAFNALYAYAVCDLIENSTRYAYYSQP